MPKAETGGYQKPVRPSTKRKIPAASSRLGTKVRAMRQARGWSQDHLGHLTGIGSSTLSKVETGRLTLAYDRLLSVAQAFDVDIAELFSDAKTDAGNRPAQLTRRSLVRTMDGMPQGELIATDNYDYTYLCNDLMARSMTPVFSVVHARSLEEFGPLLSHEGEEFAMVLKGIVEIHTDVYAPTTLGAFEGAYIDSAMGHAYINAGEGDAWLLNVTTVPPRAK